MQMLLALSPSTEGISPWGQPGIQEESEEMGHLRGWKGRCHMKAPFSLQQGPSTEGTASQGHAHLLNNV